ncbi:MAG: hypothetical protein HC892_02590 [Saprospiraceae bacterium]|nr:hypothetical protein [Saprospiraceae bacterium]
MTAFPLLQLEQHIADDFLVPGEQLFEEDKVRQLQESEKHLWLAEVATQFEVEVKISPSKVMDGSCDCKTFSEFGVCEHFVATLFALRKLLAQRKPSIPKKEEVQPPSDKFTTASILKQIDEAMLKEFVRQYAHRDRNFALALKTKFVGVVQVADNKEKYLHILDDAIKSSRKKNKSFSQRGEQKIIKITQDLLDQAEAAFSEAHFITVVWIAQAIVEKMTPIIRKMEYSAKETLSAIEQAFSILQRILERQPAPALLEELWEYTVQECQKITYRINEIIPLFYRFLTQLATHLNRRTEALQLLEQLSMQSPFTEKNYTRLQIARVAILEQLGRNTEAQKIIHNNLSHPDLLLYATLQATKREDWQEAKFLSDAGLQRLLPFNIKQQLEDVRLELAHREGDWVLQAQLSKQRLLETFEWHYFELFKKAAHHNWQDTLEELLIDIEKTGYSSAKRDFIAALYAEERKFEALLAYIQKLQSLDILDQYARLLISVYPSAVYDLYRTMIYTYLEQHLGRQASKRVQQKLAHLYQIGATDLAEEIISTLKATYPERHTLMEALSTEL